MSGQTVRVAGAGLALLAALALLIVAVTLLTRSDDVAPVRIVAQGATAVAEPASRDIRVQVSGAVRLPGVYAMNSGDRVMDAIALAGGVDPKANLSAINLARRVQDEAHYRVPFVGETLPPPPAGDSTMSAGMVQPGNGSPAGSPIDLNSASALELESLPGIGPVTAGKIIAHREVNGPFATVDDVENVPGIGPKTLESIRPLVIVTGGP